MLGLEEPVAQRLLHQTAAFREIERLVLVAEVGSRAGRAARCAQLELVETLERPPAFLRYAIRAAHSIVIVVLLFRTEQRAPVAADEALDDVTTAVVGSSRRREAVGADLLQQRRNRPLLGVIETANTRCRENGS